METKEGIILRYLKDKQNLIEMIAVLAVGFGLLYGQGMTFRSEMNARLDAIEAKLGAIENRLGTIENRLRTY